MSGTNTRSDDFVIYLKSDESKHEYPTNRPSAFTNTLNPSIVLAGNYEVSLQNLICKRHFGAIPAKNNRYSIRLFIESLEKDGTSRNSTGFLYKPNVSISGINITDSIRNLDQNFRENLILNRLIDDTHAPIFQYNSSTQKIEMGKIHPMTNTRYSGYKVKWGFSPGMSEFLGVDTRSNNTYEPVFNRPCVLYTPDMVFVYTDLIHTSHVGTQSIHMLDIIPFGENMYAKNSVSPIYKEVNKSMLDSVSLIISDEFGEPVDFDESVIVIAVLHFRPR